MLYCFHLIFKTFLNKGLYIFILNCLSKLCSWSWVFIYFVAAAAAAVNTLGFFIIVIMIIIIIRLKYIPQILRSYV